ncbi:probable inactive tRNA-specific adenosine deaminase-like protein 3 [Aricia agestis]|uniref:probable inactive tRNA-specific adenosine deaminase-like protein 3 n=1 Tax=Aricia agestis TaxID=91739 RepID=UPI001C202296|nr:probable inactive tRNA-specific adenosine deaminase-like protein 3 [Aricia agestis]XP_041988476.1 probable inactive tRNA-specific adenosine deaminase-like protein 3 [Aricia agestis]XP_041988477.1 probable inactive tRNA-specific adenosine deaminase-like protein 3 [Aricia agestis]
MTSESEPTVKRFKPNNAIMKVDVDDCIKKIWTSKTNLKAVLADDIYKTIPSVNVFVGCLKDVKDISKTILVLNEKLPLKDLQHLKRAKRQHIILCKTELVQPLSILEFINIHAEELATVFEDFQQVEVPSLPPKVKKQYQDANTLWPCNFHPNLYLEKLVNNELFSSDQIKQHKKYMQIVFELAKWHKDKESLNDDMINNAALVVEPVSQTVVAIAFDNRRDHPVQHSVMLAVDNVAKTQGGGVWASREHDLQVLTHLQEKYPEVKFGYEKAQANGKEGPYLCTGYHMYLLREPCFMCGMALVHARVKCIFFCLDNVELGALKSRAKLQAVRSLNHHFEVFTDFL